MKSVNPFPDRIPRELHELHLTNCLMEYMVLKMAETNKTTDDGDNSVRCGLMAAFARKT
jgi:hypothetical protein